ncbi:MAG: hypothetical protein RMM58_14605 [Chloroflexota bacterium]|nr:hypothetical protein [Dehalococcoidia bacterium]MDW8255104.1 hypothetical protein [Chloroflexota bacterium]
MAPRDVLAYVGVAGQLIAGHGFAAGDRHYEVVVEVAGPSPEGEGTALLGTITLIFTHCVEVSYAARPEALREDEAGVIGAIAEGSVALVEPSEAARRWTAALGRPMHEAILATAAYTLRLVFADIEVASAPAQSDWVGGAQP